MSANRMIQITKQYLPANSDLIEQLLASFAVTSEQPNVVVYGAYNAGKSSLLNSLTGQVEQEFFATRDIPETKITRTLVQDGICYVDTPGLDVSEEDTRAARDGVNQADVIMLVHKLGAGSIQQQDMLAMKKLVQAYGHQGRVMAVLTEGETARHNTQLIEEITKQLRSFIQGCTPFVVSNTSFRKGVLEGKQLLIHNSGIPQLLEQLQAKVGQLTTDLSRYRSDRQKQLKSQVLQLLDKRCKDLELMLEEEQIKQAEHELTFVSTVRDIQLRLSQLEQLTVFKTITGYSK